MLEIHYWLQVDFHQTTHDSHQAQDETFNRHVQQTKMKFDLQQLRLTSAILNNHETELISKVTTNLFLSINQDLVCLMTPHFSNAPIWKQCKTAIWLMRDAHIRVTAWDIKAVMNAVFGLDQDKSSYYLNVKVLWLAFEMFSTLYMCFGKYISMYPKSRIGIINNTRY